MEKLIILFILVLMPLVAITQKNIQASHVHTSLMYTDFIFNQNTFIQQRVILYDDFSPSTFSLQCTYAYTKNKFSYILSVDKGSGDQSPLGIEYSDQIKTNYIRMNAQVSLYMKSPILKWYSAKIGGGVSMISGNITQSNYVSILDLTASFSQYFSGIGANILINTQLQISDLVGITIPLYFEYYPRLGLTTLNLGVGMSFKISGK